MVRFIEGTQDPTIDPAGVRVEYSSRGRPILAVAEVISRKETQSTKIVVEYEIQNGTARLQGFRKPDSIERKHFQSIPIATRQVERLSCVDQVERPEKTFGEAIMEGHQFIESD